MKLLFVLRHPTAVRSLHGVFRLLAAHGHDVHLAYGSAKSGDAHRALQQIAAESPGLTFDRLPRPASDGIGWSRLTEDLRLTADSLRYLDPRYDDAAGLRARGLARRPESARTLGDWAAKAGPRGVRAASAGVRALERTLAPPAFVEQFVLEHEPDAVVATHLNEWGSPQADYIRAAQRLGIHTAYLVFSWDNLTNKGLVRDAPELVLVWNELQRREAVELQGIPGDRIRITGAPAYDHWFDWRPSTTREEFCSLAGLPADRPYVLYVCSSRFIAPDETGFVRRWAEAVRARLPDVGILVRPHPRHAEQWRGVEIDGVVWPKEGEEPVEADSRRHYFDSIHHAAAVVGINTSAQIEASIVGRPVHTVLDGEFRKGQQGTLHFRYLLDAEFGNLVAARTVEEHAELLAGSIADPDDERNERFLRRFVRPLGLDVPAAPVVVEAIEQLAAAPAPAPERGPALAPAARFALRPLARRAHDRAAAEQAEARRRRDERPSLARTLRHHFRELLAGDRPVVAGPWLDDEIGELLFWIPFLAWAETTASGLRERLVVVARPETAAWYRGIGTDVVTEPPEGARLEPALISAHRADLPAEHRGFYARLLKFARLPLPEPPFDLPDAFTAGEGGVPLDGLGREGQTAVIGRAREYRGPYGPLVFVAVLLGVPAYATGEPDEHAAIAEQFLRPPTYGPLTLT